MHTFFKGMFLVGAVHNLLGGVAFVFLYSWAYTWRGYQPPEPGIHYQIWIAVIFIFGLAYYFIYRDLYGERNLVVLSIIGKFATAVIIVYAFWDPGQEVPITFAGPAASDFIWGILYTWFFWYASTNDLWGT